MKIRKAIAKDKKIIWRLHYKLHPTEEKPLTSPQKSKIKGILLVAEESKQVVGFIWGNFITYGSFRYGIIEEFFVEKEFRKKGIGESLVKTIMKKFDNLKTRVVFVTTEKRNKEAISLYQKLKFKSSEGIWFYRKP